MKTRIFRSGLIALIISIIPFSLFGQDLKENKWDIGITNAIWFSGTIHTNYKGGFISGASAELRKEPGYLLKVFSDVYLGPYFSLGTYFSFSPYKCYLYRLGSGEYHLDFTSKTTILKRDKNGFEYGLAIKFRIFLKDDIALKPGISAGYRYSHIAMPDESDAMHALALNYSLEIQKAIKSIIIHVEAGFLSQPFGGNESLDITSSPIFYLGGGITL